MCIRDRWNAGGEDDVSGGGAFTHLTLLAENTTGMHNLFRLSSLASMEGFFYKPRMDTELLARYSEGVILSLIHISEPTRRNQSSRMPTSGLRTPLRGTHSPHAGIATRRTRRATTGNHDRPRRRHRGVGGADYSGGLLPQH